ncbi:MAG: CO dehydrogenase/CO-methylating acetyl-CoA synthase complex subunit beta [Promethearchaeota archaeon]
MSFDEYPVGVGPQFEGERVRKKEMYVELAGPKAKGFELCEVKPPDQVEDNKITLLGPDIPDMEPGSSNPMGMYLEISGKELEQDLEAVIERRFHDFSNYINGFLHLNQRYTCWMRLSKKAYKKGLKSLKMIGEIMLKLFKAEFNIIEKAQLTFYTDPKEVDKMYEYAMSVYERRDQKMRGMTDDDVDVFYACTLCASFAPKHACAITPNRMSLCGAINWFDARAAAKVDPKGPIYKIEKGELLNELAGEYTGVNEMIKNASLGEITRVYLYSGLEYPHTSCGCFEAIAFYIPEVEGYGVVDRDFKGNAVNGLRFSTMANSTGGGNQVEGFCGISIEYMRSPKFFQYDGGWNRFVWLPTNIKDRIIDYIPENLRDKIATENEAKDIEQLRNFLKEKQHPVVERWVEEEEEEEEGAGEGAEAESFAQYAQTEGIPMGTQTFTIPATGGSPGFKIIMNNVKIHADSVIIKKIKPESKKSKK